MQRPAPQDGYTLGVLVIDMKRFYPVTKFSIWPCEAIAHMSNRLSQILFMSLCMMMVPLFASAQSDIEQSPAADTRQEGTIRTLNSLITLQTELKSDIKRLGRELEKAQSPSEKKEIQAQLDELEADLVSTTQSLKEIAAGADIASLRASEEAEISFQKELFALIRPALKEMKDMTSHVRQKSELKDEIASYQEKLPVAEQAVRNLTELLNENEDPSLERYAGQLLNLRVEFERANTSSLDLVVIADFDGALADLYNRLRRSIQRWCVEACTANHWEIPFTQMTLHQAESSG